MRNIDGTWRPSVAQLITAIVVLLAVIWGMVLVTNLIAP